MFHENSIKSIFQLSRALDEFLATVDNSLRGFLVANCFLAIGSDRWHLYLCDEILSTNYRAEFNPNDYENSNDLAVAIAKSIFKIYGYKMPLA
jgi:hypothetical protein